MRSGRGYGRWGWSRISGAMLNGRVSAVRRFAWIAAAVLVAVSAQAHAADGGRAHASGHGVAPAVAQSQACKDAISAAEATFHTPPGLLLAIARAESGRPLPPEPGLQPWPWAIDADGQAMFSDDKDAALAWTRAKLASGARFVDVGCMQVNLQMHPNAFRSLGDAFDPAVNAAYAARFLAALAQEAGGNWYDAVGWYHSRTPALAIAYRDRVSAIAAGRMPPPGAQTPLYLRAIQQGTLRLPLAGGGLLLIRLNRQPAPAWHRRKTPCQVAAILGPLLSVQPHMPACRGKR